MKKEQLEIRGYKKFSDDCHFYRNGDAPKIGVYCECEGKTFTLRYGSYEILAKCEGCGKEESVHSG